MFLVKVGGPLQQLRPGFTAQRIPANLCGMRGADHAIDLGGSCLERRSDSDSVIMGRNDRPAVALSNARLCSPAARFEDLQPFEQRLAHQRVAEVDAGAVAAHGAEELAGQNDLGVALGLKCFELRDRVAHQLVDRHLLVGDAVDEARIGAVLEQPPNEVSEQLLVASDRCVDANRRLRLADVALHLRKFGIELFTHAVQALELELLPMRECFDLPDRVGVVRCERRIDHIARSEHLLRASEIGNVRRDLARPHRIIG